MLDLIQSLKETEQRILDQYLIHPMKRETAFAMASLGDESTEGFEKLIKENYDAALLKGHRMRIAGGIKKRSISEERRNSYLKEKEQYIEKKLKQGLSKSRISELLKTKFDRAEKETKRHKQTSSSDDIDTSAVPSTRTIRRWLSTSPAELILARSIRRKK